MSGKRLLDAIALFNATRAVVYKHFSIRQAQVQLYARTSSLTRGTNRFNRPNKRISDAAESPGQSATAATSARPPRKTEIPDPKTVVGEGQAVNGNEGPALDHHYERSQQNSVADSVPGQELGVQQEDAKTYPLPDGTIPSTPNETVQATMNTHELSSEDAMKLQRQSEAQIPATQAESPTVTGFSNGTSPDGEDTEFGVEQEQDVFYQPPDSTSPVLSALPRIKIPKIEEDVQGGDPHVPQKINADVYYSSRKFTQRDLTQQMDTAPEEPSEEIMSRLFHSPRVARLLGTKSRNTPGGVRPSGSRTYVTSQPHFAQRQAESSEARNSGSETGQVLGSNTESLKNLAADLSADTREQGQNNSDQKNRRQ